MTDIFVNGRSYAWVDERITFEHVCALARMPTSASVVAKAPGKDGRILHLGESIAVEKGMRFDAAETSRA